MKPILFSLMIVFAIGEALCQNFSSALEHEVFVDNQGIMRWVSNKKEVALFGANYCLPSACDYRAAGLFTDDRKKVVDEDMVHFARMGWDALRLCFWGDWENSDKSGNLIENDHLDLLDYVILKAKERGIYMLLSPIVTYSSLWPDAMNDTTSVDGFSVHFKKSELGTDPEAISAQCNYWIQLLNHINPYTGIALKDEPYILFLETINEPLHHSDNLTGSVAYINALVDAIRSTGCKKLIFHNYSQDHKIGEALRISKIDGVSFAWYPTGLNSGYTLQGNYLRSVDDYPPMFYRDIKGMPRIVYEFDSADLNAGYMYPAMIRTFRSVGAQFVTMFSYDMLVSAPYNQGWNTHLLNMIYTPAKAVSAMISARAMKNLPLYKSYGDYPQNTSFGNFKVNYERNNSIMNSKEIYMYANSTFEKPVNIVSLRQIVGVGSSPVVKYTGLGIYFLDKISDGLWRLEVYPDALTVKDPFCYREKPEVVIRIISKDQSMTFSLPDLGNSFTVNPINKGNNFSTKTKNATFTIRPGVYILASGDFNKDSLPEKIGQLGFTEFVCPPDEQLPIQVMVKAAPEYIVDRPIDITAQVASLADPEKVELVARFQSEDKSCRFKMVPSDKYLYHCEIPAGIFSEGNLNFYIEVILNNQVFMFGRKDEGKPDEKSSFTIKLINSHTPLVLFNPAVDFHRLSFTRIGDNIRQGLFKLVDIPNEGMAISMQLPLFLDPNIKDYTASLVIKDRILSRSNDLTNAKYIKLKAKGNCEETAILSLVETDGTTWMKRLNLTKDWKTYCIPFSDFIIGQGVKLPQPFPEQWNYWISPATGRGENNDVMNIFKVERLLFSLRNERGIKYMNDPQMEVGDVYIEF